MLSCSFVAYIIGQTATQYQRQHAFGSQKDMKSAIVTLQAYIVSHVVTQLQVVCYAWFSSIISSSLSVHDTWFKIVCVELQQAIKSILLQ